MIHVLDQITANAIAAGEVIERPASVVKELIENSLDAGASSIHCQIEQGGIKRIRITDNGIGMSEADAKLAFTRHATSKIEHIEDLDTLSSMGFRGEALASIAAVSKVQLKTRQIGADHGYLIVFEAGKLIKSEKIGCAEGTQIEVSDLFYNVPARYKFLKRDSSEQGYISDLVTRLALSRADVSFRLSNKDKDLIHTPGNNNLLSAIYVVFGRETAESMLEINSQAVNPVKVTGFVSSPQLSRGNRGRQIVFINGRTISSKAVTAAINEASKTWFMKGRFPVLVINLSLPIHLVDVNVHPQKTEVRFWDDQVIFRAVYHALRKAWEEQAYVIKGEIKSQKHSQIDLLAKQTAEDDQKSQQSKIPSGQTEALKAANDISEKVLQPIKEQDNLQIADIAPGYISGQSQQEDKGYKQDTCNREPEQAVTVNYTERLHPYHQAKVFIQNHLQEEVKGPGEQVDVNNKNQIKPSDKIIHPELAYLLDARLIGQVFNTYLLLEQADQFIIIDQHAAHERVLYERLHQQYMKHKDQPFPKQSLLQPLTMTLSPSDLAIVEENAKIFDRLGFEIDLFGEDTILIRTIPNTDKGKMSGVEAVQALIDSMADRSFFQEDKQDELLHTVACKAAVKAHDILSYTEMKQLVADLLCLKNPFHCPHGRPLIIKLSQTDLEKLFKRIV